MTHTITTDQWVWLYISLQTIMEVDSCISTWAWLPCLQTVIYVSGRGFVHTYTLMNGRGYHMSTDCNLRKWAWLTKEAELRYDVW